MSIYADKVFAIAELRNKILTDITASRDIANLEMVCSTFADAFNLNYWSSFQSLSIKWMPERLPSKVHFCVNEMIDLPTYRASQLIGWYFSHRSARITNVELTCTWRDANRGLYEEHVPLFKTKLASICRKLAETSSNGSKIEHLAIMHWFILCDDALGLILQHCLSLKSLRMGGRLFDGTDPDYPVEGLGQLAVPFTRSATLLNVLATCPNLETLAISMFKVQEKVGHGQATCSLDETTFSCLPRLRDLDLDYVHGEPKFGSQFRAVLANALHGLPLERLSVSSTVPLYCRYQWPESVLPKFENLKVLEQPFSILSCADLTAIVKACKAIERIRFFGEVDELEIDDYCQFSDWWLEVNFLGKWPRTLELEILRKNYVNRTANMLEQKRQLLSGALHGDLDETTGRILVTSGSRQLYFALLPYTPPIIREEA